MALHDDGTMDVEVGGRIERRRYSVVSGGVSIGGRRVPGLDCYEPELHDGEVCMWAIGSLIPIIVQAFAPDGKATRGCGRALADGQYWVYCGETDMGQTGPALCTGCGGEFALRDGPA